MILERVAERVNRWAHEDGGHWLTVFETIGALLDGLGELATLSALGQLPGMRAPEDDPSGSAAWDINRSSNALIGRDLRMQQGLAETPWAFAARLRGAPTSWLVAGSPWALLTQLQGQFSADGQTPPMVRLFDERGQWWTIDAAGLWTFNNAAGHGFTFDPATGALAADTTVAVVADWDSATVPPTGDQGQTGRSFVVVYVPAASPYLTGMLGTTTSAIVVDAGWNDLHSGTYNGSPWAATVGSNAPISLLETARGLIDDWQLCGSFVAYLILSFDGAAFAPDGSHPASIPDGTWGRAHKYDAGTNSRIPARYSGAEYVPARPGGRAP